MPRGSCCTTPTRRTVGGRPGRPGGRPGAARHRRPLVRRGRPRRRRVSGMVAEVDGRPAPPVAIGDARCRDADRGRRSVPVRVPAAVPARGGRHRRAGHDRAARRPPRGRRAGRGRRRQPDDRATGPVTRTVANAAPATRRPPRRSPPRRRPRRRTGRRRASPRGSSTAAAAARRVTAGYGERVRLRGRVTDARRPRRWRARRVALAEQVLDGRRGWTADHRRPHARRRPRSRRSRAIGPSRQLRIRVGGAARPRSRVRVRAPRDRAAAARARSSAAACAAAIPRGGALVELQTRAARPLAHAARRAHLRAAGASPARLGVRGPAGPGRVPRQAGLPFAAGLARAVSLRA